MGEKLEMISKAYLSLYTYREFHPEEVKYSWWSYRTRARDRNAGWRIDYHFVTEDLMTDVINADVLTEVMGSDHCPVYLEIETS
ncbi:MAG: hypothetical protein R6V17_08205 [Halanaerobacter sp.]